MINPASVTSQVFINEHLTPKPAKRYTHPTSSPRVIKHLRS